MPTTPRSGRPRTAIDSAAEGQYECRFNWVDVKTERRVACGHPVPEGPLTHLALNNRSGEYLALCAYHRLALRDLVEDWLSTAVGTGRLLAQLTELPDGRLLSQAQLKEALAEHTDYDSSRNGPLPRELEMRGVELVAGPEARQALEEWTT